MFNLDELMSVHVDLHVHCNPDAGPIHPQHYKDDEVITACRNAGMHGLALKSHMWPAIRLAKELDNMYSDFTVYPTVSLNITAGGPEPWTMEMAIQLGAKMVWLPTWSSLNDKNNPAGFTNLVLQEGTNKHLKDIPSDRYYVLTDENGELKPGIKEVVEMAKDANIVLATGHGSTDEALAVARFANEIGYKKLVFTHPYCGISSVTDEQVKEFAELGGYIEATTLEFQPLYTSLSIEHWKAVCELCGYDHCFLSSDHFFDWMPSIHEQYAQVMNCLYTIGSSMDDLRQMANVPLKLIEG